MQSKPGKIYLDWWKIKKSTVIGGILLVLFLASIGFGGWYLVKNDFFLAQTQLGDAPKDAAQLISYEGDVRIVRAATRETILVTRPTFVVAGDTVQTGGDGRAQIQMIDGSTLSIRPNSTIVIRDSASIFGGSDVRVSLDEGGLNVKTEEQAKIQKISLKFRKRKIVSAQKQTRVFVLTKTRAAKSVSAAEASKQTSAAVRLFCRAMNTRRSKAAKFRQKKNCLVRRISLRRRVPNRFRQVPAARQISRCVGKMRTARRFQNISCKWQHRRHSYRNPSLSGAIH